MLIIREHASEFNIKNKTGVENVYFFVVGFVNNSIFLFFGEKIKVCVHLFCIAQKMFSLTIAKWVYDIADCCYHDASCML